jgi:site-specific DNA-methyltransferase (adenine-specific)
MSINLNLGDCLEAMKAMPDNAYDLAIVDPPYGIGNFVQVSGNVRGKAVEWNDNIPDSEYFEQLKRVSCEQIIWGANYYNCFTKGGAIVWNKRVKRETNLSVCEIASYSRLKRVDYVDLIWQNLNRAEETIHPTQKPVKLYEWLLDNYAKEGDRILDTHLGSGSIAIACHNRHFSLDAWEIDAEYHAAAVKRYEQHIAQLTIF